MTTVRDDTASQRMTPSAPERPPVWRRPGASIGTLGRVLTLLTAAALTLFLLGTFLLAAARTQGSLSNSGLLSSLSIDNLRYDWQQVHGFGGGVFTTWYVNSIIVCAGGAALSLAVGVPAGYALAKIEFPFRKAILVATLLMMVIPNTVLVIPLFLEVSALHQIGQLWPVTVIFGFFPFGTYLAFIHFDTALPKEIIESGHLDGLSESGVFFRLALPVSKQAIAIAGFFAFLADWTNYFLPLVLLPVANHATLTVGLQELISGSQLYDPSGAAGSTVQLYMPQLIFAAVLQTAPLLVIFLVAQRFLARGTLTGAVKQ